MSAALVGLLIGTVFGATLALRWARPLVASRPSRASPGLPALTGFGPLETDMTVLVLGVDATGTSGPAGIGGNTDTMILFRLAPLEHRLYAFSLPRDTRVPIEGHGIFKINAACEWGGPHLAAQTVANYLQLPIDRYVLLSLDGLAGAIDALGGVDVTVPKRLDYDDDAGHLHIHLKAGPQHLDGRQAEELLRFRHDRNGTDVARVQRQLDFLMQVGRQLVRPTTALQLPRLWSIASGHARTDLSAGEILQIAAWARQLDPDRDFVMSVLPGGYRYLHHYCYWIGRPLAAAAFLDRHFGASLPLPQVEHRPRVTLWNESGELLDLKPLERELRQDGFAIGSVDRRLPKTQQSRIVVQRGDMATARALAAAIGIKTLFPAPVGDLDSDFTVELGTDWRAKPTAAASSSADQSR
ncbi:MAG: LCP family protein [Cyanobacteria bacterium REEB65]|nr:LCP family protein [Cyanobacteria bacterium REEB65]